jgi:hypothetical protein
MKYQHTHKYERTELGTKGYEIYKCMLPDCPHYVPVQTAVGRLSLCWGGGCHHAVMLTRDMVMYDKIRRPFCSDCKAERAEGRRRMREIKTREDVA